MKINDRNFFDIFITQKKTYKDKNNMNKISVL